MSIDDEMKMLSPLSAEFQEAALKFLKQASLNGCTFAGMLIRTNESPLLSVISNVIQSGPDTAKMFRLFADILDEKSAVDNVFAIDITPKEPEI